MKLSQKEKASRREAFRKMSFQEKADHIITYYKVPILLGIAAIVILASAINRQLSKKDPLLYLGMVNVAFGETLENGLTEGFLEYAGADAKKQSVYCYQGLYLSQDAATENHEYAYASRIKLLGAVNAGHMDVVLMNQEAYDILSRNGYLMTLPPLFSESSPQLYDTLSGCFTENDVVLSDNTISYELNEADALEIVTEPAVNGIDVSHFPMFEGAGVTGAITLGILANSPRTEAAIRYIAYLAGADA